MDQNSKIHLAAISHTGMKRVLNEDSYTYCLDLTRDNWDKGDVLEKLSSKGALFMVADGMGGMEAGEVASKIAIDTVKSVFQNMKEVPEDPEGKLNFMHDALLTGHKAIIEDGRKNPERLGMGTTAVLTWLVDDVAYVAWSGDSRVYLFDRDDNSLARMSEDHSYVWELVKEGYLSPEGARLHPDSNIITQSLGDPENLPDPDQLSFPIKEGDRILICSDGLNSMLSDQNIADLLAYVEGTSLTGESLVETANIAGGLDNITVLLVDIEARATQNPEPAETPDEENLQEAVNDQTPDSKD